jgi:hypothetical protein
MRDAYKKQSDCLSFNKLTLTPRNIRNEMFKFYREHLHPLEAPSFRHTLQWALQTDKYVLNWQFDFGTQLNLAAVEASWRLALDSSAAKDMAIVEAAAFVPEKRGVAPGSWADDNYTGLSFDQVCMTAMDAREDLNNERMQRTMDEEHTADQPAPDDYSTTGDSTTLDLGDLAAQLHDIASRQDDDDAEQDGFDLPEYAEQQAQNEEENGTTMSDDEVTSAEADRRDAERRTRLAAARGRYVLDEADE